MNGHDTVTDLLVSLEDRFERTGHDTVIDSVQATVPGESTLRCRNCGDTSTIWIHATGWVLLPPNRLDLRCGATVLTADNKRSPVRQ